MLLFNIQENLKSNIALLEQLSNSEFCKEIPELGHATIGEHIRHIIEIFDSLLLNYEAGLINYDNRKREASLQLNVNLAISKLNKILSTIDKPNKNLSLEHNCISNNALLTTNYFRELLYNLEHSIHHQALIKVALTHFPQIRISDSFGVAPSTLEYRKKCAQ